MLRCVLTSPSLGMMLVRWTTSRWADWETRESDDREMMWSHIPAKVLHWKRTSEVKAAEKRRNGGSEWQKEKRKLSRLVLGPRGMLWPSWERWNRNHFIRLFHIATSVTQTVSCHSLSKGRPNRHHHWQNNTDLISAYPKVHRLHSLTSKLHSTYSFYGSIYRERERVNDKVFFLSFTSNRKKPTQSID